jgi:hypothetical protein
MIFFWVTAGASMIGAFVAGYCCAREVWEHHAEERYWQGRWDQKRRERRWRKRNDMVS